MFLMGYMHHSGVGP